MVFAEGCAQSRARFDLHLDDDLNTSGALGEIYSLANHVKKFLAQRQFRFSRACREALLRAQAGLNDMAEMFGIGAALPDKTPAVDELENARRQARLQKNWIEADRLRRAIEDAGFWVEDLASGAMLVIPATLSSVTESL